MNSSHKILYVKNTNHVYYFLLSLMVLFFFTVVICESINWNDVSKALLILALLSTFLTVYVIYIIRTANRFLIKADEETIILKNKRTIKWEEVKAIKSYSKQYFHKRHVLHYVIICLYNDSRYWINVTDADYWHEDIVRELSELGKLL